jgi:hypothetical protein
VVVDGVKAYLARSRTPPRQRLAQVRRCLTFELNVHSTFWDARAGTTAGTDTRVQDRWPMRQVTNEISSRVSMLYNVFTDNIK